MNLQKIPLCFVACLGLLPPAVRSADEPLEVEFPVQTGVAIEPAHRAQVLVPGHPSDSPRMSDRGIIWAVTEPGSVPVLLPAELSALMELIEKADAEEAKAAVEQAERALLSSSEPVQSASPADLESALKKSTSASAAEGEGASSQYRIAGRVYFRQGSAAATPDAFSRFFEPAKTLSRLVLIGHASEEGSDAFNMDLSRRRAALLAGYFSGAGIPVERIQIVPMGSTAIADRNNPTKNRRVDIVFVEGQAAAVSTSAHALGGSQKEGQ